MACSGSSPLGLAAETESQTEPDLSSHDSEPSPSPLLLLSTPQSITEQVGGGDTRGPWHRCRIGLAIEVGFFGGFFE